MHLDVETTARLFEFFNVSVVVFWHSDSAGPDHAEVASQALREDQGTIWSRRARLTEDANTRLSAVEAKLANLDEEIAKFAHRGGEQIAQDEKRSKAALEEESARIVASAEQEIGVAAAQAKRGLRHFAADLAIDQAAKQLVLTPETDRALIAEFVSETGRDASKGREELDGRAFASRYARAFARCGGIGPAGHGGARPAVQ